MPRTQQKKDFVAREVTHRGLKPFAEPHGMAYLNLKSQSCRSLWQPAHNAIRLSNASSPSLLRLTR